VLGLLAATAVSQLARGRVDEALEFVPEFTKVVIYYLLLVAVVNTPARLRMFLGFLVLFIAVVAVLGLLQYHEVINVEALRPVEQREYDPNTGEVVSYPRLCSAGIFNDPNDLCLALTLGIICCLYHATTSESYPIAALWLAPVGLFGYAMILTKSRGGLLGLIAAAAAYLVAKFGWRKALPFILVGPPLAVLLMGSRQVSADMDAHDTAYERVMLWAEGFAVLTRSPLWMLTGIGAGEYASENEGGRVAHNSFVQAYVELGLFGGTLFLVAFFLAARMLYRLCQPLRTPLPRRLAVFPPFLLAAVVGYCGGMYSLSRNYIVPTYLCLGLAASYLAMALPEPPARYRLSAVWLKQTVLIGLGGFVFLKFFTQVAGALGK
jgi:putative inorganic carbon (HCO3(-)) transporter